MALNHRKDEKIQIYEKSVRREEGTTREVTYRQFIYDEDTFDRGGLWANARNLTLTEVTNSSLATDKQNVKFTVNRNDKITTRGKVIYRGEVYDINSIDYLDFRSLEMSLTAVKTDDTTKYSGDLFDE